MAPNDLVCLVSMYSYAFNRFLHHIFGMATYIERSWSIMDKIRQEMASGVPDREGNYIDR